MIYLDNAATTRVFLQIKRDIRNWLDEYFANPNSLHPEGQKSRRIIEKSRYYLAKILNSLEEEIIFTSGATESNNTIIKGLAESFPKKNHIIISPIEHKSVLQPVRYLARKGYKVDFLKVDKNGIIDIEDLNKKINSKTLFVGVIHVNNETGVVQDIENIGRVCREKGVFFFSDTVQSFGKIDINTEFIDFLSASGHKINALKGIGLLRKRKDISLVPLLHGGGQEFGIRSGTENVTGILSLHKAVEIWLENRQEQLLKFKQMEAVLINTLKEEIPEIKVVSEKYKVPYITTVLFPGINGQELVMALGRKGIEVSSGSACSTGSPMPSHVLLSCGYNEKEALSGVRFSFGIENSIEEIKEAAKMAAEIYKKIKKFTGFS